MSAGLQKTTKQIYTELGWRRVHRPEYTPFIFCAEPDKGADPGYFLAFFNVERWRTI